jgi:hypothetical protein
MGFYPQSASNPLVAGGGGFFMAALTLITIVVVCDRFKRLAKVANARHVTRLRGADDIFQSFLGS